MVDYAVMDLFAPPASWQRAFDLVLEVYTLQVLPECLRPVAMRQISEFVAEDGTLLVIARGRDPGQMPWPLTRMELEEFAKAGLTTVNFEDYLDSECPPVRRFRVEHRRRPATRNPSQLRSAPQPTAARP